MKKKILPIILLTILVIGAFGAFTACGDKGGNDVSKLQMNKKYIAHATVNSTLTEQDIIDKSSQYLVYEHYYVFYSDGTGILVNNRITFGDSSRVHCKYTLHFKYTYVDDDQSAVVCFYDSVENNSVVLSTNEPYAYSLSGWTTLFTVSKNVICAAGTNGYSFFINEEYAKQLTHLNEPDKKVEDKI